MLVNLSLRRAGRTYNRCFHSTIGFLLQPVYSRSLLNDEPLYCRTREPGRDVPKDGERVDKILARREGLANPLERGLDDGHDLVLVIRDVDAKYHFDDGSRKCAVTKDHMSDKDITRHCDVGTDKRICSRKSAGAFSSFLRNLWAPLRCIG